MKIISKDKKQKIKSVHHSIKTQMITSFVGLLICLVVTLMFINGKFLEPYYISKKESRFIELYEKLQRRIIHSFISLKRIIFLIW